LQGEKTMIFQSCRRFPTIMVCFLILWGAAAKPVSAGKDPSQNQEADPALVSALGQISSARIQADIRKLVSFETRHTLSAQAAAAIAGGRGIGAAREWIKAEFDSYSRECGGCLEVKTDSFTAGREERIPEAGVITNVYAVLKGSDPENAKRIVLVTGHYDSRNSDILDSTGIAPGANDDASGAAVSLECARVLSKMKFPATLIFLAVAGEEQGLNGSKHFAEMARAGGWNIEAALNNDIVGGDRNPQQDPSLVRVFSEGVPIAASDDQLKLIRRLGGESDSPSRELARYIFEVGRSYATGVTPMLIFRSDRYLRGGDQSSFNQQGYAAVRFTEFREDYNHQHQNPRSANGIEFGDLPKFVNFDYVASVARLNAATLASIAAAPAPPLRVQLETKQLENDSTLSWEPPPGGPVPDYEVLWRKTDSPEWEHANAVGNATRTTLPLSKDNVIFAVRTSDRAGHRSLAVVPLPER
jgi:hypothetical protein